MGIGPKRSSIIARMGYKDSLACSMQDLVERITIEQARRSSIRQQLQIKRAKVAAAKGRGGSRRTHVALRLEDLGMPDDVAVKVRMQYGNDEAAIDAMIKAGIIPDPKRR